MPCITLNKLPSKQKLIKNFQYYPDSGITPLMVGFKIDQVANGGILWDFGNGEVDTRNFVTYTTYKKPRTYNGFVKVSDPRDDTVSEIQPFRIVVSDAPQDGLITQVSQENAVIKQNTTVNFGVNVKDTSTIKKAIWHYGDSSSDDVSNGNAHHPYRHVGKFEGKVTVLLADGRQDSRPFYMLVY